MVRDSINPKFVYHSPVHFDELDPMQMLHNSRFAAHVETGRLGLVHRPRRKNGSCASTTIPISFTSSASCASSISIRSSAPRTMRIDVWVERLGTTSCVYGFLCSSETAGRLRARRAHHRQDRSGVAPPRAVDRVLPRPLMSRC